MSSAATTTFTLRNAKTRAERFETYSGGVDRCLADLERDFPSARGWYVVRAKRGHAPLLRLV